MYIDYGDRIHILTLPRVNRVGFSCLAPIARYSWSYPLLFPESSHNDIRGERDSEECQTPRPN